MTEKTDVEINREKQTRYRERMKKAGLVKVSVSVWVKKKDRVKCKESMNDAADYYRQNPEALE